MNKPYFTKYLPVEGGIKEDEIIHDTCIIPIQIAEKSLLTPIYIKIKGPCGHFH